MQHENMIRGSVALHNAQQARAAELEGNRQKGMIDLGRMPPLSFDWHLYDENSESAQRVVSVD